MDVQGKEGQLIHTNGKRFDAMIALVTSPGGRELGMHRTFLRRDGLAKADVENPLMKMGPVAGGAVQLAPAAETLAFAEGIKTALAFMLLTELPTWAALSAPMLARLERPRLPLGREIVIAADRDEAGRKFAGKLAERAAAEGRKVTIKNPPDGYGDFAEVLADRMKRKAGGHEPPPDNVA